MADWDKRFIDLADHIAQWSKDRSIKVGCVMVGPANEIISVGYNGFPRGIDDDVEERHQRPEKYLFAEHAERNAIYNAARTGASLQGCRCYINIMFPCMDCARALIQVGISELTVTDPHFDNDRWGANFKKSENLLNEVGMKIKYLK